MLPRSSEHCEKNLETSSFWSRDNSQSTRVQKTFWSKFTRIPHLRETHVSKFEILFKKIYFDVWFDFLEWRKVNFRESLWARRSWGAVERTWWIVEQLEGGYFWESCEIATSGRTASTESDSGGWKIVVKWNWNATFVVRFRRNVGRRKVFVEKTTGIYI